MMKVKKIFKIFFIFSIFFVYNKIIIAKEKNVIIPKTATEGTYEEFEDDYDLDYNPSNITDDTKKVWDPWEKMNRQIYKFNEFTLTYLAKPLYDNMYTKITTSGMRKSLNNIMENLKMPIIFANYILQLDFQNASKTLYSFVMNTTYGIGGIYDLAGHQNVLPPKTNLGITLGKYGIPAGPYLMLPLLGPNNLRGTIAWVTEIAIDPLNYNVLKVGGKVSLMNDWLIYIRGTLYVVDNASYAIITYYDIMKSSFDPYLLMREAYGQSQYYKINK